MIPRELCKVTIRYIAGEPSFPFWPCPECSSPLSYAAKSLRLGSAPAVAEGIEEGYLEHHDDYGVFTATMQCQHPACRMGVAVLGDFSTSCDGQGVTPRGFDGTVTRTHIIKAIHPAPKIITVPEQTPTVVADAIVKSFPLYWSDPNACAGSIRSAIEVIADSLKRRRKDRNKRPVILHVHLQDLKADHPKLVEASIPIKDNVGNAGAHGGQVDRESLLDAYDLLEMELRNLYEGPRRKALIEKLTKKKFKAKRKPAGRTARGDST